MFAGLSLSASCPYSPVYLPFPPTWRVSELGSAEVDALGDDPPAEEPVREGETGSTWLSEVRSLVGESLPLDRRRRERRRSGLDEADEFVGWGLRGLGESAPDA